MHDVLGILTQTFSRCEGMQEAGVRFLQACSSFCSIHSEADGLVQNYLPLGDAYLTGLSLASWQTSLCVCPLHAVLEY